LEAARLPSVLSEVIEDITHRDMPTLLEIA
jgi:hypothetical protein